MQRTQFTFYESFARALSRIKKKTDRADAYDAICNYALYGTEPDFDKVSDSVAIAFELVRPNLDASKRKAENGKRGGESKQSASKSEANESKPKQSASKKEKEKEGEIEIEKEKENECYISAPSESPKQERHKHGKYGWVLLTDDQYDRLISEYGAAQAERGIAYVDESAQQTGNKNKWKDWNLTVRKCIREGWGLKGGTANGSSGVHTEPTKRLGTYL